MVLLAKRLWHNKDSKIVEILPWVSLAISGVTYLATFESGIRDSILFVSAFVISIVSTIVLGAIAMVGYGAGFVEKRQPYLAGISQSDRVPVALRIAVRFIWLFVLIGALWLTNDIDHRSARLFVGGQVLFAVQVLLLASLYSLGWFDRSFQPAISADVFTTDSTDNGFLTANVRGFKGFTLGSFLLVLGAAGYFLAEQVAPVALDGIGETLYEGDVENISTVIIIVGTVSMVYFFRVGKHH